MIYFSYSNYVLIASENSTEIIRAELHLAKSHFKKQNKYSSCRKQVHYGKLAILDLALMSTFYSKIPE